MERLQDAIAKARAQRQVAGAESAAPRAPAGRREPSSKGAEAAWNALEAVTLDDQHLADARIVAWKKSDPAHAAFDVLRTRLLHLLREKGWRRVLITSPSKNCGKTTVATNLAVSLARHAAARTLLIDLDLKTPSVAGRLGLGAVPISVAEWLRSDSPPQSQFIRIGENLAVCPNTKAVHNSAELLQDARTARRLNAAVEELAPAAVIYDLPPILVSDDALGFLPQVDCVLLVAGAGQTTAEEIEECERLLDGNTNFLGVLLNKCELPPSSAYRYYDYADAAGAEPD